MTYVNTPDSAIASSIHLDEVIRWKGDPGILLKLAAKRGYKTDSVSFDEQIGDDEFRRVLDVWGWTDATPAGEQDWRVYVEVH
jgi:hypothetical protein